MSITKSYVIQKVTVVILCCSGLVLIFLLKTIFWNRPNSFNSKIDKFTLSQLVSTDSFLLGEPNARDRLIIFGDYECGPCMQEWQAIKAFVKRQPEKLAVYFHHFPLVKIHPLAFDEAVVAKKVSTTGSFLKIHDLLYKLTADKNAIKAILKENGIKADIQPWEISFRTQVSNDLQLGLQLGVKGTPYMIYIDSANNAFHLSSINSLKV